MAFPSRLAIALALVLLDLVTVAVPLAAFGLAYVLVARPPWFLEWVVKVYRAEPDSRD